MPQTDDIPDVWVNGIRYPIVYDPDSLFEAHCDLQTPRIIVGRAKSFGHGPIRALIMHELLHAIDTSLNLLAQIPIGPQELLGGEIMYSRKDGKVTWVKPVVLSEECVRTLSDGLFATFSDPRNRAFVGWLLEPDPFHKQKELTMENKSHTSPETEHERERRLAHTHPPMLTPEECDALADLSERNGNPRRAQTWRDVAEWRRVVQRKRDKQEGPR